MYLKYKVYDLYKYTQGGNTMKKLIPLLILTLLISVAMVGCGQPKAEIQTTPQSNNQEQKETLKIASDAFYSPMEYLENDKIVGFSADLANALGKEMNRKVEFQNVGWDDIFDSLYAKKYDLIISSVTITPEREKTMLFSNPYYTSSQAILSNKDKSISSAKDLSGKTVAVQDGTTAHDILSNNIAGVNLKTYDSGDEALTAFKNNEVEAIVIDSPVIYDYAKKSNNANYVVITDETVFGKEDFGIVANKGSEALIAEINNALQTIKQNGEYNKIYDKYFKVI